MTSEDVRKFLVAKPFQPFEIRLVDGRVFTIRNPEFATTGRTSKQAITVFEPGKGEHMLNTLVIGSINILPGFDTHEEVAA